MWQIGEAGGSGGVPGRVGGVPECSLGLLENRHVLLFGREFVNGLLKYLCLLFWVVL